MVPHVFLALETEWQYGTGHQTTEPVVAHPVTGHYSVTTAQASSAFFGTFLC